MARGRLRWCHEIEQISYRSRCRCCYCYCNWSTGRRCLSSDGWSLWRDTSWRCSWSLWPFIFSIISFSFIGINHKTLKHIDLVSLFGSSARPNRWCILQPSSSGIVISFLSQLFHLSVVPSGHCHRLASVTDGLMGTFAITTYKSVVLDANCGETNLAGSPTVRANTICWQPCQLSQFLLCWSERHDVLWYSCTLLIAITCSLGKVSPDNLVDLNAFPLCLQMSNRS